MGVEFIFIFIYLLDLNFVEFSFNKVKCLLNGRLVDVKKENLKIVVEEVVEVVFSIDVRKFYLVIFYLFFVV